MITDAEWEQRNREHFQGERAYTCTDPEVRLALNKFERFELTWPEAYAVFEKWEREQ